MSAYERALSLCACRRKEEAQRLRGELGLRSTTAFCGGLGYTVDSQKLEYGVIYADVPSFCFGIRGPSYSNFLASTVGPSEELL